MRASLSNAQVAPAGWAGRGCRHGNDVRARAGDRRRLRARLPSGRRMTRPTTQLVDGLAYQVVGDGPIDLLFVNAWFTDLELQWEEPGLAAFLERLASFSRVVLVDKRGMGRSARVPPDALPSVDERAADLATVLNAVGADRVAVASASESGPLAMAFTAANPERVRGLALYACRARYGAPLLD